MTRITTEERVRHLMKSMADLAPTAHSGRAVHDANFAAFAPRSDVADRLQGVVIDLALESPQQGLHSNRPHRDRPHRDRTRTDRPTSRVRVAWGVMVCAALVAGAVVATRDGSESSQLRAGIQWVKASWKPIPAAPIPGRQWHMAVWTGTEMIVFGGFTDASHTGSIGLLEEADGAAYNPTTNTWRRIADDPFGGRANGQAAWVGSEMWIAGGSETVSHHIDAYDPRSDSWRIVTTLPFPSDVNGTWELIRDGVVFALQSGDGSPNSVDVMWRFQGGHWEALPSHPHENSFGGDVALWGDAVVATVEGGVSVLRPGAGSWEFVPVGGGQFSPRYLLKGARSLFGVDNSAVIKDGSVRRIDGAGLAASQVALAESVTVIVYLTGSLLFVSDDTLDSPPAGQATIVHGIDGTLPKLSGTWRYFGDPIRSPNFPSDASVVVTPLGPISWGGTAKGGMRNDGALYSVG